MQETSLGQIAEWCGGRLIQGRASDTVAKVSTDSRSLEGGELFVALKGERFDGHDFIDGAAEAGVAAILVSTLGLATQRFEGGIVHVKNSLVGLQELALRYRRSRPDLFVVGITGSNGKTSTKDFLANVLGDAGKVNATRGNLNNHIGLPLTILSTGKDHEIGVWEMGMSTPGEIEVLAEIANPDAAVITNIGTAHIEHLKTREAIQEEKGQLAEAVGPKGIVVLNANDEMSPSIAERCRGRVITAGIGAGEVSASNLSAGAPGIAFNLEADGKSVRIALPVPGAHMVSNALLAAAVGRERGLSLEQIGASLEEAALTGGRLEQRTVKAVEFIDDSYNANPDSMKAALATLATIETTGKRIAVLGRMAELGGLEDSEHRDLGRAAAESGVEILLAVGTVADLIAEGAGEGVETILRAEDQESAAAQLSEICSAGDLVLVKGSRSSAMEKVIEAFEKAGGTD